MPRLAAPSLSPRGAGGQWGQGASAGGRTPHQVDGLSDGVRQHRASTSLVCPRVGIMGIVNYAFLWQLTDCLHLRAPRGGYHYYPHYS